MLDENIEKLSPDESVNDTHKEIGKNKESITSEDKKAEVKKADDKIVEKEEVSEDINIVEHKVEQDTDLVKNVDTKEKTELEGPSSKLPEEVDSKEDAALEKAVVEEKEIPDNKILDPEESGLPTIELEKPVEEVKTTENIEETVEGEPSKELVEETAIEKNADDSGSVKSQEVDEPSLKDEKTASVKEAENRKEADTPKSDEEVIEGVADADKGTTVPDRKVEKKMPTIEHAKLTLDEIVVIMQELVENFSIQKIKVQFEALKSNFNKKYKSLIEEKKKEFINEGGNEIDFKYHLPAKNLFNDIIRDFKRKRQKYYRDIEIEQKQNHERKLQLIDNLKELIDTAEPSTMYKNFRILQDEWRTIGQIPHTKYNDVWRTYHHHVERFYDLLHLNNDFRDLDFKHNLEEKTKLIERVEKLGNDPDVNRAFKELQIIHRMWKEDIGPVGREIRDEVWNRFSEATKKIHDRRHEFQNEMESKFKANVDLKLAIVEKIKAIKTDETSSHKLWQNAIREMENLRKEFFAIGRVPRSKSEEVWQIFKDATRDFNKSKNAFYKKIKHEQSENLSKKMQLIEQAESLKDSDEWTKVTEVFKRIQAEWKAIGHVPRRDSDRIWKRFKDACNHYFDQLHNMQDGHNKGQAEVFNKKKELLEKFKEDIEQEDKLTLDLVNTYISEWRGLGAVPVNMRHIEGKLNKAIDSACKKLNISKEETAMLKFKNQIDSYFEQKDVRKLDNEQLFLKRKVDDLTKEIKQLENNISFISNATADNILVKNVYKNIETYSKDLKIWQRKLAYIRQLDY